MTLTFPAHIFPDETIYGVEFPDVPGCYTYGETFQEALQYAVEALTGHLEVLLEYGDPIPTPSEVLTVKQPGHFYTAITCEVDEAAHTAGWLIHGNYQPESPAADSSEGES